MKWVDYDTVLEIYDLVIKSTGGTYGIRDKSILESALFTPLATFDGRELYPGVLNKVAVLLYKIANNHPFVDGNKRVAFVTAVTVLASNGFELNSSQEMLLK